MPPPSAPLRQNPDADVIHRQQKARLKAPQIELLQDLRDAPAFLLLGRVLAPHFPAQVQEASKPQAFLLLCLQRGISVTLSLDGQRQIKVHWPQRRTNLLWVWRIPGQVGTTVQYLLCQLSHILLYSQTLACLPQVCLVSFHSETNWPRSDCFLRLCRVRNSSNLHDLVPLISSGSVVWLSASAVHRALFEGKYNLVLEGHNLFVSKLQCPAGPEPQASKTRQIWSTSRSS